MKIEYKTEKVYGNQLNYPMSEDAKFMCDLMERKTLRQIDLQKAIKYGHEVVKVQV